MLLDYAPFFRKTLQVAGWLIISVLPLPGSAGALDAVTSKDASAGLRAALSKGVDDAITRLGSPDGFLRNPKYAIPLPPALAKAERALSLLGMSGDADALKTAMNHAAESAVAEAKPIFKQALQHMTVSDAKSILVGGDDAATQYYRQATSSQLATKFKPIVARATAKVKLGALYDQYAGRASQLGLLSAQDANLNDYVTSRALEGLFGALAEEERAIRKDPLGQGDALIKKVFGAL
jgi:hypothetical protein